MKSHIMRLAVQDLTGSHIRKRALRLNRRELWLLYLELLLRLHEAGGRLPAQPEALVDELEFFTVEELRELIPLLAPVPGKVGGIEVEGDELLNRRLAEELALAQEYSEGQALRGARGGLAKARAIRKRRVTKVSAPVASASAAVASAKQTPGESWPSVSVAVAVPSAVAVPVSPPEGGAGGVLLEELACPACKVAGAVIRERPAAGRTSPGWHCWPKQGGCGAFFELSDPRIVGRLTPRVQESIRRLLAEAPGAPPPAPVEETAEEEALRHEAEAAWFPLVEALKATIGVHPHSTWIRPLRAWRLIDGKALWLEAPNNDFRRWVLDNHLAAIQAAAEEAGLKVGVLVPGEVHSAS